MSTYTSDGFDDPVRHAKTFVGLALVAAATGLAAAFAQRPERVAPVLETTIVNETLATTVRSDGRPFYVRDDGRYTPAIRADHNVRSGCWYVYAPGHVAPTALHAANVAYSTCDPTAQPVLDTPSRP